MSRTPAVTVVVPSRSRSEPLRRALRAVFRQRYDGELECLVAFDSPGEQLSALDPGPRVRPTVTLRRSLVDVHWHESSVFEGRWETIIAALQYLLAKHSDFELDAKGRAGAGVVEPHALLRGPHVVGRGA